MLSAKYSIYISSASVWIDFFFLLMMDHVILFLHMPGFFFNWMPDIMNFTF